MKKRVTGRAPEMERFTHVECVSPGNWRVTLTVENQSFTISPGLMSKSDAYWLRDMLCIALAKVVRAHHDARVDGLLAATGMLLKRPRNRTLHAQLSAIVSRMP